MKKIKIILVANPNPTFEVDHPILTLVFYAFSIPIMVLNAWAWDSPHIIQKLMEKRNEHER